MTKAKIYYHDIGDYLSREEKLDIIHKLGSVDNPEMHWQKLSPNEHSDWINQRNNKFSEFMPLAPDKKFDAKTKSVYYITTSGLATSRDAWCYNSSKNKVSENIKKSLSFFNEQSKEFAVQRQKNPTLKVEDFIDLDATKISWDRQQKKDIANSKLYLFEGSSIIQALYRPFYKQWGYFNRQFNNCVYQLPILFPTRDIHNLAIIVTGVGASKDFSVLMTDSLPNYHTLDTDVCFPLYWYEETKQEKTLFDSLAEPENEFYARRDAISDFALNLARQQYGGKTTKKDIFYYVYGFLHNPDYRTEFAADLKKMLPRIPFVSNSTVFWKYVKAGRELADLHLHYEDHTHEAGVTVNINNAVYDNFEVTKMRFPSKGDKSTIIYNPYITITDIPAEAYEYVVNGKSAIEWIMERYQITTHKESGIVNDPNDWAHEHNKPRYILDLLLSVIAISVKTVQIVKELPNVFL